MKSLCVTGSSATNIADVAEVLRLAGIRPAKAIQHGTLIDMHQWHERTVPMLRAGQPVGRLWEKAAEELLLANLESHAWGWHSHLALWAMEFWADLDSSIHFLLIAESPEDYLAKAWLAQGQTADNETLLEEWRVQHARMLEFYLAHPERSLVVDATQALTAHDKLLALIGQRWELPEASSAGLTSRDSAEDCMAMRLAMRLAEPVCSQYADQIDTLRDELEAAIYPLQSLDGSDADVTQSLIEALQQFQKFPANSFRYEQQAGELEQAQGEVTRLDRVVARQASENDALLVTHRKALYEKEEFEQQVTSLKESADRLRTDLQRAHERSEDKAAKDQREQFSLLDERKRLVQELEIAREQAVLLTACEHSQATLRDEYEALLLSLYTTQEQLETTIARHQIEQAEHTAERESLQEALRDAQAVAEQHSVAAQASAEKHTVAQREAERLAQECEALLISLHQAQESLEGQLWHYASQQASMQTLGQRLIALKQRGGPSLAADTVEISHPAPNRMEWRLANLLVGKTECPSLAISGTLAGGNLQLEVKPGDNEAWRLDPARPVTLNTLLPAQRELAQSLPTVLQAHLPNDLDSGCRRKWQRALAKLDQSLEALPPQLRFDTPELHHVQVNPDYEHLWIKLPQASFAGSDPQQWQFRVSCANVTPNAFGEHPKLELPRQECQLLQGWFEESRDDFGSKLELRFALPNAMDGGVWKRLQPHDQRFLQSLMTSLPDILSSLEQQGHRTGRDWQDWHRLAANMRRILQAKAV